MRWAWWLLAWSSLALGLVGIVVPGLPTVPFVLLSAYAAARGSARLHAWLLAHPRFGPMIGDQDGESMRIAADALCQFMPGDIVLSEILMGGSPP